MGCASSNLSIKDLHQKITFNHSDYMNHVVSLTSSTYGALKLHKEEQYTKVITTTSIKTEIYNKLPQPEFINSWDLIKDLDEEEMPINVRGPLKFLNQTDFSMRAMSLVERENGGREKTECSPETMLGENDFFCDNSWMVSPEPKWVGSKNGDDEFWVSPWRRSLTPMFDPMLIESYEKELHEGEEQIKMIVSSQSISPKPKESDFLKLFEKKCPPGGENGVVIYTTTLGGIRKTFEDCNTVRMIIESHQIQMFERDLSMDSGFREELRELMGDKKEVKIPIVFVKGRLVGGADEVMKLDDEGKLRVLFDGIPRVFGDCEMCGNVRFVICTDCHGSCKIFDEDMNVNCGECNENGLIRCLACC